jgi:hypothetical protein
LKPKGSGLLEHDTAINIWYLIKYKWHSFLSKFKLWLPDDRRRQTRCSWMHWHSVLIQWPLVTYEQHVTGEMGRKICLWKHYHHVDYMWAYSCKGLNYWMHFASYLIRGKWYVVLLLTNSSEQSPSWDDNSHSTYQEIPCTLWNSPSLFSEPYESVHIILPLSSL